MRLNLTKSGYGVTFGPRGLHYSLHSSGRHTFTAGIPGTGLYWQDSTFPQRSGRLAGPGSSATRAGTPAGDLPASHPVVEAARQGDREALRTAAGSDDPATSLIAQTLAAFLDAEALPDDGSPGAGLQPLRDDLERAFAAREKLEQVVDATGGAGLVVSVELMPGVAAQVPLDGTAIGLALAHVRRVQGDLEGALELVTDLPSSTVTLLARAELLTELARFDDVVALGEIDIVDDVSAACTILRAGALREAHRLGEALDVLDELLAVGPVGADVRNLALVERSRCLTAAGRHTAAQQDLAAALAADAGHPAAQLLRDESEPEDGPLSERPELDELQRLEAELSSLHAEVVSVSLAKTTLEAQLAAFNATHLRMLGERYAHLDQLRAQDARARAEQASTAAADQEAEEAEERARSTRQALEQEADHPTPPAPTAAMKALFKRLVKRLHPDLSTSEEDRVECEGWMRKVNDAWYRRDHDALLRIDEQTRNRRAPVAEPDEPSDGTGPRLIAALRGIAAARRQLSRIQHELSELQHSAVALLFDRVNDAAAQGRDLLADMAEDLDRQIAAAEEAASLADLGEI